MKSIEKTAERLKVDNLKNLESENDKRRKSYEKFVIFICFLIYFAAQLGRYSYTSNINLFIETKGVNKTQAGLVSTLYFLFYGAGQIINGILCKRYNKRAACFISVCLSSILNAAAFFDIPFFWLYILWPLNAAAQSILYPSLMLTISEKVEKKYLAAASVIMAAATTVGTFASYGISALFSLPQNFKYSFIIAAAVMTIAGIVWVFDCKKMQTSPEESGVLTENKAGNNAENAKNVGDGKNENKNNLGILAFIELSFFAFVSYAVNGGTGTWTPTIIKDLYGLSSGLSAFLSAFLPFFGIFNSIIAEIVYRKCKSFNKSSFVLFGGTAVFCLLVLPLINVNCGVLLALLAIIRLFSGAATNLYTAKAPLYLADRCNAGFLSGFLNGLCYLGNAVSSFALGVIADNSGWNFVFIVFAVSSALPLLCYPVYLKIVKNDQTKKL